MIGLTTPTVVRGHCNRLSNVSKVEGLPLAIPLSMLGCSGGPIPTEASHRVNRPQNQRWPFRSRPVQHSATRSLAIATAGAEWSTAPRGLPAANAATLSASNALRIHSGGYCPLVTEPRPIYIDQTAQPMREDGYPRRLWHQHGARLGRPRRWDSGLSCARATPLGVADRGRGARCSATATAGRRRAAPPA
jgi:hypothetical protein